MTEGYVVVPRLVKLSFSAKIFLSLDIYLLDMTHTNFNVGMHLSVISPNYLLLLLVKQQCLYHSDLLSCLLFSSTSCFLHILATRKVQCILGEKKENINID